jgi:hypothetical protein
VTRPRAADDFAAIRARMEELRLERDRVLAGQKKVDSGLGPARTATSKDEGPDEQRLFRSVVPRRFVG